MTTSYYLCALGGDRSVLIGLRSRGRYTHALLDHNRGGLDLILCQSLAQAEKTSRTLQIERLKSVPEAQVPEHLRFQLEGSLIEAGRPWGGNFVHALQRVMEEMGFAVGHDPHGEGSDSYSVLVGPAQHVSAIEALMWERHEHALANPDDWDALLELGDGIEQACTEHGVIWLETDWKHFEIDLSVFERLGLSCTRIEAQVLSAPEGVPVSSVRTLDHQGSETLNVLFSSKPTQ